MSREKTNTYFQHVNLDSAIVLNTLWLTKLTAEIAERTGLDICHFH